MKSILSTSVLQRTSSSAKITLTVYFLICAFTTSAQNQSTFAYKYYNGYICHSVRELDEGNSIVLGGTDGYDMLGYEFWDAGIPDWRRNADIFLMKNDKYSKVLWQRTYGTDSTRDHGRWLEITFDGGFIIAGSTTLEDNIDAEPMDSSDVLLVKTDSVGELLWAKRYDSGFDDVGYSVQQTADSGFIVSAFTDLAPISLVGSTRAWLIRTDKEGNVEWEGKYQFAIRDFDTGRPFIYVTKQTKNKGYIIVGTTFSSHQADLYVMRLDSVGVVEWAKSYDYLGLKNNFSGAYDVWESPWDTSFVITGFMDKDRSNGELNYPYIIQLDDTGAVIKARGYDYFTGRDRTGFSSVRPTTDSGFVFCGKAGYGESGEEMVMLKTDKDINMIWGKHYAFGGIPLGGGRNLIELSDGGFLATGVYSFGGVALIKMDEDGDIACHAPGPLVELTPTVSVVNWNPDTLQGYTMSNWTVPTDSLFEDTTVTCALQLPLPVHWLAFEGIPLQGNVRLNWKTSNEIGNSHFEIERSAKGIDFTMIGTKQSYGPATKVREYVFVDENPMPGSNYYRLRQVDLNGNGSYSEVVAVNFGERELELKNVSLQPGSEAANLHVEIFSKVSDKRISIEVVDLHSRTLSKFYKEPEAGINRYSFDLSGLSMGIYIVKIWDGFSFREIRKVMR